MNRINEFKPCPICGKSDCLDLDGEHFYNTYSRYMGVGGCVQISCNRCRLGLYAHGIEADRTWNYQILVGKLKEKWNAIKR